MTENSGFPEAYSEEAYCAWHEAKYPADAPLREKVEERLESLRTSSRGDLRTLAEVLHRLGTYVETEARLQSKKFLTGAFDVQLLKLVGEGERPPAAEIFKPADSVIEKMWRKNRTRHASKEHVVLANLAVEITDLVRTSVVCPSLFHIELLVERLPEWRDLVDTSQNDPHNESNLDDLLGVDVDAEAKLAKGYFAYHAQAHFASGLQVEIQLYPTATAAWRKMSHRLYEVTRVSGEGAIHPGSKSARLASVGHMLHLAECELVRLMKEYGGDSS